MYCFYEIIIGLFIIALDTNIKTGGFVIDIISDAAGCLLIFHAMNKMKEWSPCFKKASHFSLLQAIVILMGRIVEYYPGTAQYGYMIAGITTILYINMICNIMEGLFVKNKTEGIDAQNVNIKAAGVTLSVTAGITCILNIVGLKDLFEHYNLAGGDVVVHSILNILFCVATAFFCVVLMQNKQELEAHNNK